jgi:hypothetical protein
MRRTTSAFVVFLVLLLPGSPASAQDEFTAVSFDGVAFAFSPELGESVDSTRVPGQPTDQQQEVVPADAPHVTFTLYGPAQEGERTPRVGFTGASVRAYRLADLADYDAPSEQVEELRALLEDRSALAGFMTVSEEIGRPLPHVPVDTAAAQVLRARATFIETTDLTGIAYLIGYRQDFVPFAAGDFVYTFQALSNDGEWYVCGDFFVEAAGFPERIRARDARDAARRWEAYLGESVATLDAAAPDTFSPPLTAIDALIGSIVIVPSVSG